MKSSIETLQNFPYFIYTKTQSCFFHLSFHAILFFPLMNALVYDHRPGHSLGEKIKLHEMKNEKTTLGFHIPKVWQILKHLTGTFHQA